MCDYSLHIVKSRPAKVGDKLTTRDFGTGTRGFAASRRCERSGLRTSGYGAVFFARGCVLTDGPNSLAR